MMAAVPRYRQRTMSTASAATAATENHHDRGQESAVLHRNIKHAHTPMEVVGASGTRMVFSNGYEIEDTTCGASVACLGHGNARVKQAMIDQLDKFSYCNSMFFSHKVGEDLATELINGTEGVMSKAFIMSSGTSR